MTWTKRLLTAGVSFVLLTTVANAGPVVFSSSGANPAAIQATVDAFRASLGTLNPNVAGSFGSGRREINWDGVPDIFSAPNNLPANFFNSNSPRGAVYSTPGSGFEVSANNGVGPVRFDNINPGYSTIFQTFSQQRLFTSLGSTVTDVTFFVPGTSSTSSTSAFGAVFADVDLADTTMIQYFDTLNNPLGAFFVPTANNGLSFLGVRFDAGERIGRVRIISGNTALGAGVNDGGAIDVVAMDDFIYGEPSAPEPSTWALMGGGLLVGAIWARRRGVKRAR